VGVTSIGIDVLSHFGFMFCLPMSCLPAARMGVTQASYSQPW